MDPRRKNRLESSKKSARHIRLVGPPGKRANHPESKGTRRRRLQHVPYGHGQCTEGASETPERGATCCHQRGCTSVDRSHPGIVRLCPFPCPPESLEQNVRSWFGQFYRARRTGITDHFRVQFSEPISAISVFIWNVCINVLSLAFFHHVCWSTMSCRQE